MFVSVSSISGLLTINGSDGINGSIESLVSQLSQLISRVSDAIGVHSDGAQASGVFCALTFICDRIKEEQMVDVFLAVQTVRTNRPQFITDMVITVHSVTSQS